MDISLQHNGVTELVSSISWVIGWTAVLVAAAKNMITGTIPDAMRNLTKLQVLALDRNPMRGHLPEWLSELQSLELLGLSALSGKLVTGSNLSLWWSDDKQHLQDASHAVSLLCSRFTTYLL